MIRRFFCLLLVALMLANQGLIVAHAHHAADFAEPEGHASRPHFHVGGHVHHDSMHNHDQLSDHSDRDHSKYVPGSDEHDAALPPDVSPLGEHDSDAVYCHAETVILGRDGTSVSDLAANDFAVAAILGVANQSDGLLRLGPLRGQPASVFDAACPIYLRTLSLRI